MLGWETLVQGLITVRVNLILSPLSTESEMYVNLEFVLCELPMKRDVQLGLEERPIRSGSNIPTPQYHRYCITHAGSYSHTYVRFLSQLFSRQLRVSFFSYLEEQ